MVFESWKEEINFVFLSFNKLLKDGKSILLKVNIYSLWMLMCNLCKLKC